MHNFDELDDGSVKLPFNPWWNPLNLTLLLFPGVWGVLIGAALAIAVWVGSLLLVLALVAWAVIAIVHALF